jgi:thiosulfate/3-mercaptopyruvate sulfurtransferase
MAKAQVLAVHEEAIVDAAWLIERLDDPAVRVVEVDVTGARYQQGHIPGAVLWNAYTDLHHSDYSPAEKDELESLLSKSGISATTTVVFYGYAPYLGFWLMKSLGHHRVRILGVARDTWIGEGYPWTTDTAQVGESTYALPAAPRTAFASLESTWAAIGDPDQLILDVRTAAEYAGDRFWPSGASEGAGRPGHIPGAIHLPIEQMRAEDGSLKSSEEIRKLTDEMGISPVRTVTTYCTIGGRATEAWFVLTHLLGFQDVRVYAGSWANWGTRADTPIEIGAKGGGHVG